MPDNQRFPIPNELEPPTRCLCLEVPDNEDWLRVFAGLLAQPSYWFNWERDSERSGKTLAQYWTKLYDQIDWSIMSCCCDQPPAIYRYNADGVYQRSTDGGATWTDAPGYDYRNTSTVFPPPSVMGIDNTKCQAADGVVATIQKEIVEALDESFAAGQILALIAAVLLAVLSAGSLLAFTPLITAIGAAIVDVGVAVTQAAFTSDVWDRLRCNVYCHMDTDDSIDAAGFDGVLTQLGTDETGIVYSVLYGIINAAGVVGITNMIRSNKGDPDANCDDCCAEGCDISAWGVLEARGTLVSQTTHTAEIDALLLGDGLYWVSFSSPDTGHCCDIGAQADNSGQIYVISGTPSASYYSACGHDPTDFAGWIGLSFGSVNMNGFSYSSATPFTVGLDTTRT